MLASYFLCCAISVLTLISGHKVYKSIPEHSNIEQYDERIKMNLDDLEVHIEPPPGRKVSLNPRHRTPRYAIDQHENTTKCTGTEVKNESPIVTSDRTKFKENSDIKIVHENLSRTEKLDDSFPRDDNEVENHFRLQKNTVPQSKREIILRDISVSPATLYAKYKGDTTVDLSMIVNITTEQPCRDALDCENRDLIEKERMARETKKALALQKFIETHMKQGYDLASNFHHRARSLVARGLCPHMHTASMLNLIHSRSHNDVITINKQSELALFGTRLLQQTLSEDYNMTPAGYVDFLHDRVIRVSDKNICQSNPRMACNLSAKYRTIDGSCNNIAHPFWGRTNSGLGRVLPPRYSDGIHGMPISVTGADLPNPRTLSTRLITRGEQHDPELSLLVMQWGQAVAHDLARQVPYQTSQFSATKVSRYSHSGEWKIIHVALSLSSGDRDWEKNNNLTRKIGEGVSSEGGIECCANDGASLLDKSLQHHSCAPIEIPPSDQFYSHFDQRCMNFVRSMTVLGEDCVLGPARQLNAVTSFLDSSQIYGVSDIESKKLREFFGGRLKVEYRQGRWWLPTSRNESEVCDIWTADDFCYVSGDPRTSQNPQLVVLHTLLVREHNRVAMILSVLNPHWDDEKLFQETRRIVIAEYQHITYTEWLPVLFGDRVGTTSRFASGKSTMSNEYNENVDPSTLIGFTSGAYRSLHSMVVGHLGVCDVDRNVVDVLKLDDFFFRPAVVENDDNFAGLLRGLMAQHMEMQDTTLPYQLTEFVHRSRKPFGMDLIAIDIQRGRDHGVPGYNAYRQFCDLRQARNFDDLYGEISPENVERLRRGYAHVDDIDLVIGASMENLVAGSRLGPTNFCLLREQFHRSRVGDRYFYDNANSPHSFTPEQFEEITKVTLSRLICDTESGVGYVQPEAFRVMSPNNPLVVCENLPKLDLTLWKE